MINTKKKLTKIVLIVLAAWLAVMLLDLSMVSLAGQKPIFCISFSADDGGSGNYYGLGYSFDIKGKFLPEENSGVTSYAFKLFGFTIKEVLPPLVD